MLHYSKGAYKENGPLENLNYQDIKAGVFQALKMMGEKRRVLIIPPDFTRFHSGAGIITQIIYEYYGDIVKDILPALGTHFPMSEDEIKKMYGDIPLSLFRIHDWRNDIVTLGRVPAEYLSEVSEGKVDFDWPAQVNKIVVEGNYDLILSVGQVVPHEVIGMANHNKNVFVGTGGSEGINKSHFLGAAYGMERIMGRADSPVRKVLDYAEREFAADLPLVYIQTVMAKDEKNHLATRGLFISDDRECFDLAAELSLKVNFQLLNKALKKIVVFLDPSEYRSTWLGNKSIYRTRMAIEDGGELIVLAPGLREFGEDKEIDVLIRKYGYVNTKKVLKYSEENEDLGNNLSAAAHLIHGSTEGRFSVTYCTGGLTRQEIESVNYNFGDIDVMMKKYNPETLKDGVNIMPDGEEIFFISNPALGLWAFKDRFKSVRL